MEGEGRGGRAVLGLEDGEDDEGNKLATKGGAEERQARTWAVMSRSGVEENIKGPEDVAWGGEPGWRNRRQWSRQPTWGSRSRPCGTRCTTEPGSEPGVAMCAYEKVAQYWARVG
mgnify:CR=1 FL=1